MLKLFDIERKFYDKLHFYFDRAKNLNLLFTLNFVELLKEKGGIPEEFIVENKQAMLRNLFVDIAILDKGNVVVKGLETPTQISLFKNNKLVTFTSKTSISDLLGGKYKIRVDVRFPNYVHQYLSDNPESVDLSHLKLIIEEPISRFAYNATNLFGSYSFESDILHIRKDTSNTFNLYDIYQGAIRYSVYKSFIESQSELRGISYDGVVPVSKFVLENQLYPLVFNLETKEGNKKDYQNLLMGLLQKESPIYDYEHLSYGNSLFLEQGRVSSTDSVSSFERVDSLSSDACGNDLFSEITEAPEVVGSDILFLSTYYKAFPTLDGIEFWKDDFRLIPVYLLNIFSPCDIYYLSSINENSMSDSWERLTNTTLDNLGSGNYLCMISSKHEFLNNSLLENYFILVK